MGNILVSLENSVDHQIFDVALKEKK